jgi:hypothetical protein
MCFQRHITQGQSSIERFNGEDIVMALYLLWQNVIAAD